MKPNHRQQQLDAAGLRLAVAVREWDLSITHRGYVTEAYREYRAAFLAFQQVRMRR